MPTLASELRNRLERVVIDARDAAEAGAHAALNALAVEEAKYYPHMSREQQELRNHLRARARQLGDRKLPKPDSSGKDHEIDHLVGECAYEHWHRMLFARFLAENGLLMEPQENMAISLAEAEELAKEDGVDVWVFASRCAQQMLPQIFRPDDPLLQVSFATEHMLKLEKLLASLPHEVFTASDALGWVYQFWQSKKKDEINHSEVKIGADEIAAVTQLFTEPYMVQFLLHNTLGAWWAGTKLTDKDTASAKTEDELRVKLALPGVGWEYLRFVRGADGKGGPWRPAAGTFDGWPKTAADLKVLDPCCGSGHFLVASLHHLVPIRMAEEGLSADQAVDAVLRDNLHGLEIDERCCQIAAFALAFAAWTYPDADGYRPLPELHIACTGIGPEATEEQWLKLAQQSGMPTRPDERERVKNGLLNLHGLFSDAPTLGSLINPRQLEGDVFAAGYQTIQPYLAAVLEAETSDGEIRERAIAAAGMVKAADLLTGEYTLVATNVPYLGRGKQDDLLRAHLDRHYDDGKADLATAFVLRCIELCSNQGTSGIVTPQNWLFLTTYTRLRKRLLRHRQWNTIVHLGEHAFQSSAAAGAFAALLSLSARRPTDDHVMAGIDVSAPRGQSPIYAEQKAALLRGEMPVDISIVPQTDQLANPDARIVISGAQQGKLLSALADGVHGLGTKDSPAFIRCYWEVHPIDQDWELMQASVLGTRFFGGLEHIVYWQQEQGILHERAKTGAAILAGAMAHERAGVVVTQVGTLACTLYMGGLFEKSAAVVALKNPGHLPALWAFCEGAKFREAVRRIDSKVFVTNTTLVKVPFDLAHWQKVAAEKYTDGLPEPESDDPTQWLFHGRPEESAAPLQVAVVRLLGYRWPAELDSEMRLSKRARALAKRCEDLAKLADDDGIVCVPSVRGEETAAQRLEALLSAAGVTPAKVRELAGGTDLDNWLRDGFFEEHCRLFHDRPFVWHIWDGRKRDGFHALVNYHKLCQSNGKGRKLLESLTYSYLGEWITRQKDAVKRGEGGAEDRLAAALELQKRLEAILAGEPPFDIFVRWKALAEQPTGWEPDINDGVRMNIRPFLALDLPIGGRTGAGILRWKPNIKWSKDRGKEPQRPKADYPWFWNWDEKTEDFTGGKRFDGNRWNDLHYTSKVKQAAHDAARKRDK